MPPYLPQSYSAPAAQQPTNLYSGINPGFMTLPVERTVGGARNNIFDPSVNPFPNGPADDAMGLGFNPYTQGYWSNGQWNPYLPDKIVLGQRNSNSGPVGQATQWINGKEYNINGNNYEAGQTGPKPYEFATAPGDARMSEAAPFDGFHFGEAGKPGYKFMAGSFDAGKFYSQQPEQPKANQNLGILQPWNPALNALQQSRSQP